MDRPRCSTDSSGTTPARGGVPRWSELSPQIRGGLTEQIAAQQLRIAAGAPTFAGQVHHWRREGGRNAEIDYLLELGARILPVEVKSGASGGMKRLHQFMFEKQLPFSVRLGRNLPSRQLVDVKTTRSRRVRYQLLNLPHYLTWRLPRLLEGLA